ncbi:hypothetical protein QNO07_21605 [Streptomyces sp. 549]|uniref:hypothetical protein n=1 Tax=Streptomyces sp. 549 TaxID=3049076 RepID=UPI0024C38508|nr:hypothetical protein [Streptomyces sp. 549]MDK1475981.1 hypothetical protein [Streptomyces sp. 549]
MYGPATPPPSRAPQHGPGTWALIVRTFFALLPLLSLTLLAWVPLLRFAVLRRRSLDWWLFFLSVGLTLGFCWLLLEIPADAPDDNSPETNRAIFYMLVYGVAATVYGFLGDRFPRERRSGWPAGPPGAYAVPHGPAGPGAAGPAWGQPQAGPHPQAPGGAPAGPYAGGAPAGPYGPGGQAGAGQQPGSPRMRRVASELDELDALLRKREKE